MKIRMEPLLKFWIETALSSKRQGVRASRTGRVADALRRYEEAGEAMRYRDWDGKISWKATPQMLQRLADAEYEAEQDYQHAMEGH